MNINIIISIVKVLGRYLDTYSHVGEFFAV